MSSILSTFFFILHASLACGVFPSQSNETYSVEGPGLYDVRTPMSTTERTFSTQCHCSDVAHSSNFASLKAGPGSHTSITEQALVDPVILSLSQGHGSDSMALSPCMVSTTTLQPPVTDSSDPKANTTSQYQLFPHQPTADCGPSNFSKPHPTSPHEIYFDESLNMGTHDTVCSFLGLSVIFYIAWLMVNQ